MEINTVIDGEYKGKRIDFVSNSVFINKSTFGLERINKETTKDIEILSKDIDEQYQIRVLFISGKESTIYVDSKICEFLIRTIKINTVIEGEYKGLNVKNEDSIYIDKDIKIDKKNVNNIELISYEEYDKNKIIYTIKIIFASTKESIIYVDDNIYNRLIKIWPEKQRDRLKELLSQGYKIVGYTSCFLGSAFGTSTIVGTACARMQRQHDILLQKDINVELISFIEEVVDGKMIERDRKSFIVSPISDQNNKLTKVF